MNPDATLAFLEAKDLERGLEALTQNSRYLDGLALKTRENLFKAIENAAYSEKLKGVRALLLLGISSNLAEEANEVAGLLRDTEILMATDNVEEIAKIKEVVNQGNLRVGTVVNHPTVSLNVYVKARADFIVMPPTLVRGRVLTESRARKVRIIARLVNDVATCAKLIEAGIYGIVTTVPTLKREARKFLKH